MAPEVLVPSSAAEAVALFGDGAGTTVIGGGTVVVPEITLRPARPRPRAPARRRPASTAITSRRTTRSRSAPPLAIDALLGLADHVPALAACAANLADYEIRGQATVGGNLCAGARRGCRRAATSRARCSRSTRRCARRAPTANGRSRSRTSSRIAMRGLVLDVSLRACRRRRRSPCSRTRIPTSTPCSPSPAPAPPTARSGSRRPVSPAPARACAPPRRLAGDIEAAGTAAVGDVTLADDALASAWYREQTLPVLVRRVLTQLEESA